MKQTFALICAILFMSGPALSQSQKAQVVSTAEIVKIDAKKKSLQVRQLVEPTTASGRGAGGGPRTGGGGVGRRGGGRRGGGVGFPGGGSRYPGGGGSGTTTQQAKEYKIFVTKDTALKFAGANIDFTDLHVGDRITISGTPKGSKGDLDATSITRED
jgi:hypothetical protein